MKFLASLLTLTLMGSQAQHQKFNLSNTSLSTVQANDVYDPTRARIFTYFSAAAYCDVVDITFWQCEACKILGDYTATVFTDRHTKGQAFVAFGDGAIVVSFRGSSNLRNWISDLNVPQTTAYPKCKGCRVHTGFFKAWKALAPDIVEMVKMLMVAAPDSQLFFTGHSLGAALAVLAAADIHYTKDLPVTAVYTYGEPRVGNAAFRDYYNQGTQLSWRVTHYKDVVPHLPYIWMGYHHISTEVFYNKHSTDYKICDGSGEDKTCSMKYPGAASVDDHLHYLNINISSSC